MEELAELLVLLFASLGAWTATHFLLDVYDAAIKDEKKRKRKGRGDG